MGFSVLEKALMALSTVLLIALVVVVAVFASQSSDDDSSTTGGSVSDGSTSNKLKAICIMQPTPTNVGGIEGYVLFEQTAGEEISINVNISNMPKPADANANKLHGFHVHYYGDITTCKTTGGHYNPDSVDHAGPTDSVRHPGDFGNLEQDDNQTIVTTFSDPRATLFGDKSIIGRAIVIHAGRDDLGKGTGDKQAGSLASGNAGSRLACCVIGRQAV